MKSKQPAPDDPVVEELKSQQAAILQNLSPESLNLLKWVKLREMRKDWSEVRPGPGRPSPKLAIMDYVAKELVTSIEEE